MRVISHIDETVRLDITEEEIITLRNAIGETCAGAYAIKDPIFHKIIGIKMEDAFVISDDFTKIIHDLDIAE
jgi:hypothetical protein